MSAGPECCVRFRSGRCRAEDATRAPSCANPRTIAVAIVTWRRKSSRGRGCRSTGGSLSPSGAISTSRYRASNRQPPYLTAVTENDPCALQWTRFGAEKLTYRASGWILGSEAAERGTPAHNPPRGIIAGTNGRPDEWQPRRMIQRRAGARAACGKTRRVRDDARIFLKAESADRVRVCHGNPARCGCDLPPRHERVE